MAPFFKIKKEKLITIGLFLLGLSSFNYYLFDPSCLPLIQKIIIILGFFCLIITILPIKVTIGFLIYLSYITFYNISGYFTNYFDQEFQSLVFTGLVFVLFFIYLEGIKDKTILKKSINLLIWSFIIINTLSFFVFVLFTFKIPLPYETINLAGRGFLYNKYLNILIVCNYVNIDYGNFIISRFNGAFPEPSWLGTYAGLLLIIDLILFPNEKLKRNFIIFLGLFTFSFAFYIFLIFFLIFKISFKRIIYISILATVSIFFLLKFIPQKPMEYISLMTIERFTVKDGKLVGNNRAIDDMKFNKYLDRASGITLLFGNGKGRNGDNEASYSSYVGIIYESGFIGFGLFLLVHFYYLIFLPVKFKQYKYLIITILPILSIYYGVQVIGFLTLLYFISFKFYFQYLSHS